LAGVPVLLGHLWKLECWTRQALPLKWELEAC
jgi:hypothetical protein